MEEVWAVYLCLILMIIVLVLMKQNPHVEEARKQRESKPSPPSSSFSPSNIGKKLEYTQEELDMYLERLNHVLFNTEARKRDGHQDQKSHHRRSADVPETKEHTEKETKFSEHLSGYEKVQEKSTSPRSTENIVEEIEQAVQETTDTDLHERRQQRQSRRYLESYRPEASAQPETDTA